MKPVAFSVSGHERVDEISTTRPGKRFLCDTPKNGGGSIGSDLVNGLKGLFTLPPNFRKYSRFISYGWGGFAVVGVVAYSSTWIAHRLSDNEPEMLRTSQELASKAQEQNQDVTV